MDMGALPIAMVGSAGRSVWTDVADAFEESTAQLLRKRRKIDKSPSRGRMKIGLHSPFKAPVTVGQAPRSMQFMSACIHLSIGQLECWGAGQSYLCMYGETDA
ncbi:Uncharacterized protein HZ326_14867 [Fusarium oxysporum f. sp. albedinis]|nr:Uncharacterized protein HZ326_14867 [Fusarium oxysporum f. sp. albedinis]